MSQIKLRQIESGNIIWFSDGSTIATANWNLGGFKLTNLADPIDLQDAATKAYVDARVQGLRIKDAVKVATTANITLSGTQTVDSIALSVGDRVLVKNQTTGSENGIYLVSATAWVRASDAVNGIIAANDFCFVSQGTTQHDTGWTLTTDNPIIVGTTSLTYTQFSGAGSYTNGTGISLTGNVFSLNAGLNLLTDVIITSPISANVLRYNGTNWVNTILSYTDLSNKPTFGTLITNATTGQTASAGESFNNTITLHKISKTGSYNDLLNLPTIPTIGILDTTNTTALSTSASESFTGNIDLHKIAKTGTYSDLLGKPTIPSAPGTLNTTSTTSLATNVNEALSGAISLHKISKTGILGDLTNVVLSTPVNGNILSFNGTNWINTIPASSTVTLIGAVTGTGQTGTNITTTIVDSYISNKWDRFRFTTLTGVSPTLSGVDFTNMMSNNNTLQVFLNGVLQDIYVGVPTTPSDYDGYINVGTLGSNKIQFTTALVSTDVLIIMGIF